MDDARDCELCGRRAQKLLRCRIEESVINVCHDCAEYGTVIKEPRATYKTTGSAPGSEETVVADYASRIRRAREKKNISITLLASNLCEKESIIHRIEQGKFTPPLNLAKKLERALGITLIDKAAADDFFSGETNASGGFTLGDIIKEKLSRK